MAENNDLALAIDRVNARINVLNSKIEYLISLIEKGADKNE